MAATRHKWDFFIAHAGPDQHSAEVLYDLLRPFRGFLACRRLMPGDDWDQELPIAQRKSLVTLVLISSSTNSAYYQREEIASAIALARAKASAHRVIPIFLDSSQSNRSIHYGLRGKHSLDCSSEGGLENVARKIRAALRQMKRSRQPPTPRITPPSSNGKLSLRDALGKLNIAALTAEVVEPLAAVLHVGRVEYGDYAFESGRLILSFGQDTLRRPHVLCIIATVIGPLARGKPFLDVIDAARAAKTTGVHRENGAVCLPDEVWLITSHAWDHDDRQQASQSLQELTRENIKIIANEELCGLLIDNLPKIASQLSRYSSAEVVGLISALSKHSEGRAFGFSADRNIDEFYVTAALSPYAKRAYAGLRGDLAVADTTVMIETPLDKLIGLSEIHLSNKEINALIKLRARSLISWMGLSGFDVDVELCLEEDIGSIRKNLIQSCCFGYYDFNDAGRLVRRLKSQRTSLTKYLYANLSETSKWLIDNRSEPNKDAGLLDCLADDLTRIVTKENLYSTERFKRVELSAGTRDYLKNGTNVLVSNRLLLQDAFKKEILRNGYLRETVSIEATLRFESAFQELLRETKKAISHCPSELGDEAGNVKRAWDMIERTETFLRALSEDFGLLKDSRFSHFDSYSRDVVRIRVPKPDRLLKLDNVILVEGPPGCGKTTLLRTLAIKLLTDNRKVFYLACSTVSKRYKKAPLSNILKSFARGSSKKTSRMRDSVLILDGLDEASFDMSRLVFAGSKAFRNIVVSSRSSFQTMVRAESFRVVLSPFNNSERDLFFEKWFRNSPELISQVRELIEKYPDIDLHTRLPLIATIMVALLQNGIVPKTRAEIYAYRLELLLSKWDHFRGVNRLYVDNPDAKRRFLRELAFFIHSSGERRRYVMLNHLKIIYERSLGAWGYKIDYRQLVNDLVVGSGVLLEDPTGYFSLGHLTFQEHLAAEYLVEKISVERVSRLIGSDWWHEPLNFYASIKGDITDLIDHMMSGVDYMAQIRQLAEMAAYAPYTSPGALQCLTESLMELHGGKSLERKRQALQNDLDNNEEEDDDDPEDFAS